MIQKLSILMTILLFSSCSSTRKMGTIDYGSPNIKQELKDDYTFKVEIYSTNKAYGFTEKDPIMVGGNNEGPKNQRRFLNALSGPNGEVITYNRLGSCCLFKTKNSEWGGMLDMYNVSYVGLKKEIVLYINMYDSDTLMVPVGFTLKE